MTDAAVCSSMTPARRSAKDADASEGLSSGGTCQLPESTPAPSPRRPRLLWRGALLLVDGTALPGVAFMSHSVTHSLQTTPASPAIQTEKDSNEDFNAVFAADADLCLTMEMMRHAPLRITAIVEDDGEAGKVEKEKVLRDKGHANAQTTAWPSSAHTKAARYIDPRAHSTLAFFERMFCSNSKLVTGHPCRTERVLLLSLETSATTARHPFGSTSENTCDGGTDPSPFPFHPPLRSACNNTNAIVCIFGQLCPGQDGANTCGELNIQLVVGRRYRDKTLLPDPTRTRARSSGQSIEADVFGGGAVLGLRPDDPLPRATRPFKPTLNSSRSALQPTTSSLRSNATKLRKTASTSSLPTSGKLETVVENGMGDVEPSKSRSITNNDRSVARLGGSIKVGNSGRTPGRRGEKRSRHAITASQEEPNRKKVKVEVGKTETSQSGSVIKEEACSASILSPFKPKHLRSATFSHYAKSYSPDLPLTDLKDDTLRSSAGPDTVEQRNRSSIKKLVHSALLRRGVLRGSEDYAACFNATRSGTALALRATIAKVPIDKEVASRIVTTHLALYLPPNFVPPSPHFVSELDPDNKLLPLH